jgi:hypothetical protein
MKTKIIAALWVSSFALTALAANDITSIMFWMSLSVFIGTSLALKKIDAED